MSETSSVVLADSHVNMLEGVRGLLETEFETVVMVTDKKSLFETISKLKPGFAVVDLSLPASGEVNIAREIKQKYPDLKLIILSIHDEPAAADEVIAAGACGFVLKRTVCTELFDALEDIQQGKKYVSPL